ncbi:MAG: Mut7-C RNAse domain-containing protein [Nitrospirae bacterium]|nr:Mut7-C RNAse domain-containing protein [Nitrospirota bacterium]
MLGRLARWLRLLGFDTLYFRDIEDRDLLRIALREERCLLTRDTHFLTRKNLRNLFFVRSDEPREQVKEVIRAFGRAPMHGRCVRCNGILRSVDRKDSVRDAVPEYVFLHGSGFLRCEVCGGVYWEGTHLKRFRAMLDTLFHDGPWEEQGRE